MKKKDCFTGLGMEVFGRVVMRGFIYIGRRKYFSAQLLSLAGKRVEVVRFRDDLSAVSVFFDGESVCVADHHNSETCAFPYAPFIRGHLERAAHRRQRRTHTSTTGD